MTTLTAAEEVKCHGRNRSPVPAESTSHAGHVHCTDFPRLDRTEELSHDVEGTRMEKNISDHGASAESRKGHLLKNGGRRRAVSTAVRNLQRQQELTQDECQSPNGSSTRT